MLPRSHLRFVLATSILDTDVTLHGLALKGKNKYDQMPSDLFDQMQHILPLVKKVADEIISKETEILEGLILRMFKVMHRVARLSCDYVKCGRW